MLLNEYQVKIQKSIEVLSSKIVLCTLFFQLFVSIILFGFPFIGSESGNTLSYGWRTFEINEPLVSTPSLSDYLIGILFLFVFLVAGTAWLLKKKSVDIAIRARIGMIACWIVGIYGLLLMAIATIKKMLTQQPLEWGGWNDALIVGFVVSGLAFEIILVVKLAVKYRKAAEKINNDAISEGNGWHWKA
ncbi:MAG: hypothetical protein KAR11_04335 [Phycisphaerae bacterium]|nr:hypothetical protein [Phycisphaerae bacterium]